MIELGGGIFEGCSDQKGGALMSGTKGTDGFVQETLERALTLPYVRLQSHILFFFQLEENCFSIPYWFLVRSCCMSQGVQHGSL